MYLALNRPMQYHIAVKQRDEHLPLPKVLPKPTATRNTAPNVNVTETAQRGLEPDIMAPFRIDPHRHRKMLREDVFRYLYEREYGLDDASINKGG